MTLAAVKEKLHDFIEHADGKKVKAMYTLVENDIEQDYEFTDEDMKELDSRWEDYLSGKTKSYTLEESKEHVDKVLKRRSDKGMEARAFFKEADEKIK